MIDHKYAIIHQIMGQRMKEEKSVFKKMTIKFLLPQNQNYLCATLFTMALGSRPVTKLRSQRTMLSFEYSKYHMVSLIRRV